MQVVWTYMNGTLEDVQGKIQEDNEAIGREAIAIKRGPIYSDGHEFYYLEGSLTPEEIDMANMELDYMTEG